MKSSSSKTPGPIALLLAACAGLSPLVAAGPASAGEGAPGPTATAALDGDDPRVEMTLLVDQAAVRPGAELRAGVRFELDEGWHIYWKEPGDGAFATRVTFETEGAELGPVAWPAPEVFVQAGGEIVTHGYADDVLLAARGEVHPAAEGRVRITAEASFLVCKVDCIPGEATLQAEVPVQAEVATGPAEVRALFDRAFDRQPASPDAVGAEVRASFEPAGEGRVEGYLDVVTCDESGADHVCSEVEVAEPRPLLIEPELPFTLLSQTAAPHPDAHRGVRLALTLGTADKSTPSGTLAGVIRLVLDGKPAPIQVEVPVHAREPALPALNTAKVAPTAADGGAAAGGDLNLAYVLLLAFLGGLILNLMPCVFPVLAIKVISFVETVHEERSARLAHAGAYTAGIVASMLVLAAVVIGLKVFGTQVGWGFQFQSGGFLVLMCAVLVVFAMSFFDVFTVGMVGTGLQGSVDQAHGLRRSVGEGVLAVALSTPCSAPLLGTAVGFALAAGGLTVVAVFVAIGLGLAAPFVVLTQAPGLAKVLPRPGTWMVHARYVLGFTLIFAVVWLLWILGRVVGADGLVAVLVFLVALAMASWIYGAVQKVGIRPARIVAVPLVLAAVVGGALIVPEPAAVDAGSPARVDASGPIAWEAWSPESVQETLKKGKPVFVDFTADWCITCKANENGVITQDDVVSHMRERGVVPMKADWTRPDERIRKALEEHGKAGVPMYLVYNPSRPDEPEVLPEVLTADLLTEAFDRAMP